MLEQAIQSVLSHYAVADGGVRRFAAEPISSGWSGSRVWRVAERGGDLFCLRQWPEEHPTIERLRMIHSVLLHVAAGLPAVAYPLRTTQGQTIVEHGGHFWELTTWRTGTPDFRASPSRPRLRAAMRSLATFHNLAGGYAHHTGPVPAVRERVERLMALEEGGFAAIERAVLRTLGNSLDDRTPRLLELLRQVLSRPSLKTPLAAIGELQLLPAIRDIHHEHVLFTCDEVTGIIDFGALRIDTPLTDVARLVGSLVGGDRELEAAALNAYGELRPLSAEDRRLIRLLDETGVVLSAANWLTWLYLVRRDMGAEDPIARRLDEIIQRLEQR